MNLHKTNYPMRPVVAYVTAPAYKLCRNYVNSILPVAIYFVPKFTVRNTLQLIDNIRNKAIICLHRYRCQILEIFLVTYVFAE